MHKLVASLIFLLSCFLTGNAQHQSAAHSVITIGNVVDITGVEAYAKDLLTVLDALENEHTIIFNGDLSSLPASDPSTFLKLDTLIDLLRKPPKRKLIFLPGDRDWSNSGPDGWDNVVALEKHIRRMKLDDVIWPLRKGCPGPERVSLGLTLSLIAINTQWWNHDHVKPSPATATCKYADEEAVIEEIKGEIEDVGYGNVIVAGHFPIISHGMYGGSFPWHKWLFPVPVVNTAITAYKQNVGSSTELSNEHYEDFREDMEEVFQEYHSIIYLSGHEKNREVLQYGNNVFINSGAPQKGKYIDKVRESFFASSKPGIIVTNFDVDGNTWVSTYAYADNQFVYEGDELIMQAPCTVPLEGIAINERMVPCLVESYVLTEMSEDHPAEVEVSANANYTHGGLIRTFFGKHYRESWAAPVTIPILDLDTAKMGLRPYAVGGGRQTTSLKFMGEDGYAYVFRSVDKDPSKALSFDLQRSLVSLAVRDQTTTQYPYGAIVASAMLDSLDILHSRPQLFVIPDDPKLGPFQDVYGNMLGMLEDFPTGRKEVQHTFGDADKILRSVNMFRELFKTNKNRINSSEFSRARAFDLLVGDWGKHEDNWKWAGYKTDSGTLYRPIPRDRDHVFSRWDGVLPWIADREWAKPSGENFNYKIRDIRSLTWQARHLDRFLASELDRDDWQSAAQFVKEQMTDAAIDSAIAALPIGTEGQDVDEITAKLKVRRDNLIESTDRLYDLLAKEVDVVGSVKKELFEATRLDDGKVLVEVFKYKGKEKGERLYSRTFDPDETKEIRLFGLLGNDRFEIQGDAKKSILIRVIPGIGKDHVVDSSSVQKGGKRTHVYSASDDNVVSGGNELKNVNIPFEEAYRYNRTAFEYNTYFPYGFVFYSSDNGLQLGGGVTFTKHAYNKPDFSSKHYFSGLVSTLGNVRMSYEGTFRHVLGEWDLVLNAQGSDNKRFNYFFGLGNDTEINKDSLNNDYYTLRYSSVIVKAGLKRMFWKRSSFEVGLQYGSYGDESSTGNILDEGDISEISGANKLRIARVNWALDMDLRDKKRLPTSGMRIMAEGYFADRLNVDGAYSLTKGVVEWHGTARPVTFSLKAGGWLHHRLPPFYDLQYLGYNTHLRGYRRNRFAGDRGGVFFNSDVRIQVIDNARSLIPHKIGLLLFYDMGRVFQDDEDSNTWHHGYGFGVYAIPIREQFVIGLSLGFSVEESAFFRFGFGKLF